MERIFELTIFKQVYENRNMDISHEGIREFDFQIFRDLLFVSVDEERCYSDKRFFGGGLLLHSSEL